MQNIRELQFSKYFFFSVLPAFPLDTIPISHKYLEDPSLQFRTVGSCAGLKGVKIVPQNCLTSGVVFMTVWLSDGTWTHGTGNRELGNPIHLRFHCQMITPHFVDTEVYVFLRGACRWTWKVGKVFTPTEHAIFQLRDTKYTYSFPFTKLWRAE